MLLQVDVDSLIKNHLTIDQFLVASMIYEKNYVLLEHYLDLYSSNELKVLFIGLIKAGLIDNIGDIVEPPYDFQKFTVRSSFIKILAQGDFFDELVQVYPASITRPDGTKDYLRTDLNRCRKLYSKITGDKYIIHLNILDCLKYEVSLRRKESNLSYMKRLPNWLRSEEWKSYEQRMKDEAYDSDLFEINTGKEVELGYGNNLI